MVHFAHSGSQQPEFDSSCPLLELSIKVLKPEMKIYQFYFVLDSDTVYLYILWYWNINVAHSVLFHITDHFQQPKNEGFSARWKFKVNFILIFFLSGNKFIEVTVRWLFLW